MEPVRFNLKAIEDAQVRIASFFLKPKSERRQLVTQTEREPLIELDPVRKVFNEQTMDHVAE